MFLRSHEEIGGIGQSKAMHRDPRLDS